MPCLWASLVAQVVKNLPAKQVTQVQSLGWEWLPTPSCLWTQNYVNKARIWIDALGVQFSSVAQSCPTLCDPMSCSTPGLPVQHQLPEPSQTHVHCISDAIQASLPLSSLNYLTPNVSTVVPQCSQEFGSTSPAGNQYLRLLKSSM